MAKHAYLAKLGAHAIHTTAATLVNPLAQPTKLQIRMGNAFLAPADAHPVRSTATRGSIARAAAPVIN